jgi:hypothetical protein
MRLSDASANLADSRGDEPGPQSSKNLLAVSLPYGQKSPDISIFAKSTTKVITGRLLSVTDAWRKRRTSEDNDR